MCLNIFLTRESSVYRLKLKMRKTLVLILRHPVYPSYNAAKK